MSMEESNISDMPVITEVTCLASPELKRKSCKKRTITVNYGPISVRKHMSTFPTLATGRRSIEEKKKCEDAFKREHRLTKNRESAYQLKVLRRNIKHELETKVNELICEEQHLLMEIDQLQRYKQYLEHIRDAFSKHNSFNPMIHFPFTHTNITRIDRELCCGLGQSQMTFSMHN